MSQQANAAVKGLTTKKIILIFGSLIIICAAIIIAVLLLRDKPEVITPVANASNIEQIQGEIKDKVAKGMFMTHMNTTWTFTDGKSASDDAVMGNSSANSYPFWFEVTLTDTNEVVYKSGLLPVGQQISEIKLEKDLDKGTYPATLKIQMVDENGEDLDSNMGFNITLIVKK